MANSIERLNYYEREYLRSFDFVAEQTYHLEMRRRLNLALHLWGVVDGLDVVKGNVVLGAPDQFYITEGMAIDAYGREIVLFAPYVLSADDLHNNRVGAGAYSLWIAYYRNLSTPPSAGYGLCDIRDQYTRWNESFKIVLKPESYTNATEPRVFDALEDDPAKAQWLVRLGTLKAEIVNGALTVTDAKPEQRTYIGLRAQRVVASVANLTPGSNEAKLPITVEADLQEKKNLTVGAGFDIDPTKVTPPPVPPEFPTPADFPGPAGNVKANNLFFLNNLYGNVGGQWLGLKEYVKTILPDIQIGTQQLTIAPTGTDPSTDSSAKIHVKSALPVVKMVPPDGPRMIASISAINWIDWTRFIDWLNNINLGNDVQLEVGVGAPVLTPGTNNEFDFPISWTIGPTSNPAVPPPPPMLNVSKLIISWVAIFHA